MSKVTSIALVGLGEVGQILAKDLAGLGFNDIAAFDILFCETESIPSRAVVPVRKCTRLSDAVKGRDLIISAVTAAADLAVATDTAPLIAQDAFFLDLNSVSPGQKQKAAKIINEAGGRYVEASVMTPFPPKRIASPMLLGGPFARAFLDSAQRLGLSADIASESYGRASATKMCRSVVIKGVEALLTESLLSARFYGVEEPVLASLSDLMPVGDWRKLSTYMISRSLEHGRRRSEEMREVAETVREAGIAPLMSRACVDRQEWGAQFQAAVDDDLNTMLDAILASMKSGRSENDH